MNDAKPIVQDVFGLKPYGEAARVVAQAAVDGAAAVLSRICNPAFEEFGFLLRDQVSKLRPASEWRFQNLIRQIEMTEAILKASPGYEKRTALPRLVKLTLEQGSWVDTEEVRKMWAGLLASSCTANGKDESNLIFVNLLSQLTSSETRILNYLCQNADKVSNPIGVVGAYTVELTKEKLLQIAELDDVERIIRELDHLNALKLIEGTVGSEPQSEESQAYEALELEDMIITVPDFTVANVAPTSFGINLYVRCQGSLLPARQFFQLPE